MQATSERVSERASGVTVLSIKIATELMMDKCRHDGLRGMDFTDPHAIQYPSHIANGYYVR